MKNRDATPGSGVTTSSSLEKRHRSRRIILTHLLWFGARAVQWGIINSGLGRYSDLSTIVRNNDFMHYIILFFGGGGGGGAGGGGGGGGRGWGG